MAEVAGHLNLAELQAGYRTSGDVRLARHYRAEMSDWRGTTK